MSKKPVVKSKKRYKNAGVAMGLIALASVAVFVAYQKYTNKDYEGKESVSIESSVSEESSETVIDSSTSEESSSETVVPPPPVANISFEEFMEHYSDLALSFANQYVKADLLNNKSPLSQTWGFHANDEDELDSISLTYTYSTGETSRVLEIANATFTNPIDLDKIVDNEVKSSNTRHQVTRQTAFSFDAKDSYLDSELADALFAKVCNSESKNYYSEVTSDRSGRRKFVIAEETSTAIKIYNVYVEGNTEAEVISNLNESDFSKSQTATYPLGDNESITIKTDEYELEEFAPETVNELINDYDNELKTALDTHLLEKAGKDSYGNSFDPNKLEFYKWEFEEGQTINSIRLISKYNKYSDTTYYTIKTITLKNPIEVKDITKDNIDTLIAESTSKVSQLQEYSIAYNPAEQGTRDDLVNAIFEAYGMSKECPEDAERYFIKDGSAMDPNLGAEVYVFEVAQIGESEVKEFTIRIKASTNDEGYIEKLKDSSNYIIYGEESCVTEGIKLEGIVNTAIEPLADTQANYNIFYNEE